MWLSCEVHQGEATDLADQMTLFYNVLSLCELELACFSDWLISLKDHLSSKLLFLCYSFLLSTYLVMICWNLLEVCNMETLVEDITVSLFMLYIDFNC